MKRRDEVIRHLLEYVRDNANAIELLNVPNGAELRSKFMVTDKEVHYHVELCVQAGLLRVIPEGDNFQDTFIPVYRVVYLTWWGHEYLDGRGYRRDGDWSGMGLEDRRR